MENPYIQTLYSIICDRANSDPTWKASYDWEEMSELMTQELNEDISVDEVQQLTRNLNKKGKIEANIHHGGVNDARPVAEGINKPLRELFDNLKKKAANSKTGSVSPDFSDLANDLSEKLDQDIDEDEIHEMIIILKNLGHIDATTTHTDAYDISII